MKNLVNENVKDDLTLLCDRDVTINFFNVTPGEKAISFLWDNEEGQRRDYSLSGEYTTIDNILRFITGTINEFDKDKR